MDWLQWSNPVARWWVWLVSISAVNLVAFVVVRRRAARRLRAPSADELRRFHQVVALCGVYTVGCAFRSVLPRADVQRICLWDTWWSNVFVGRSVATVAELSFVLEGALVLFFLATYLESSLGRAVARAIVPLIVIAECFSWYAVLTTHYLGNAVEESLWTLSYSLVGLALLVMSRRASGALRGLCIASGIGALLYVSFMVTTDVPMYVGRLMEDAQSGRVYLSVGEGVRDLLSRWVVTHDPADWQTEMPWMTLYFSVAVWLSIALCLAPLTRQHLAQWPVLPQRR